MRICTLISSYEDSTSPYKDIDPYPEPARWMPEHTWTRALLTRANAEATLERLEGEGFDVFVNLCDGAPEEDIAGVEVIEHLSRRGLAFTGADARFYSMSREAFKQAYDQAGVPSPGHVFVSDVAAAERAAERLRFPLFVKPTSGYASVGIEKDSRVDTRQALVDRVARTAARFGGALIEEFIAGREFTILVSEPPPGARRPVVHTPVEVRFPPEEAFKHFELKWTGYQAMDMVPVTDEDLVARLRELGERTFLATKARGYCRCDVRMNGEGELFMLDCNANPGVFYPPDAFGSADFILSLQPEGHRTFLTHIIEGALRAARP
ncbi:D-alanine--D-alanine ligase [Melittangium boletus]|uniref:ATP-grasp domain-containing protein n=1 Tax=Melittangium boletus DSM 14713 TaxID=1294270 RepID=A0A250IB70_9BACT|nr:D-alanine--D-alanine ligase [Melittangium boletus]ATB28995.1 hypothetical protein MEBOL_002444 [Melittangium boletus DSM 14713]